MNRISRSVLFTSSPKQAPFVPNWTAKNSLESPNKAKYIVAEDAKIPTTTIAPTLAFRIVYYQHLVDIHELIAPDQYLRHPFPARQAIRHRVRVLALQERHEYLRFLRTR